jgi:hypothetical protein
MASMPDFKFDITGVVEKPLKELITELLDEVKRLRADLHDKQTPQYVYHYYPNSQSTPTHYSHGYWNYPISQWQVNPV